MKLKQFNFKNLRRLQAFTPVLVVGILMLTGAVIYNIGTRAASTGFYFTSGATSYQVGQTFNVGVYEDSGSQCTNVVKAYFTYPTSQLTYVSGTGSGSNFEASIEFSGSNGQVAIRRYTTTKSCSDASGTPTSGYAGAQLIGTVTFKATAAGTATLNFQGTTMAVNSVDQTNAAPGATSKSFTLTAVPNPPPPPPGPSPTPAPSPSPSPTPAPSPAPRPSPTPTPVTSTRPRTTTTTPTTSITPTNTDTSLPVANNDVFQTDTPVDVQPLPVQPDGINKIEYYLNSKLMATVKTAPYKYHLDTTKLLNGKYTLTTKTYYSNGQVKSVSQTVLVNNPFGFTQLRLRLQKLAWLIILLLLLGGAALAAWIFHKRSEDDGDYYDDGTYETDDTYEPDDATVIAPTGSTEEPGIVHPGAPIESGTDWQPPAAPTTYAPTPQTGQPGQVGYAPPTQPGYTPPAPTTIPNQPAAAAPGTFQPIPPAGGQPTWQPPSQTPPPIQQPTTTVQPTDPNRPV